MSETVSTVSRYLAVHKQKRNELRRELLAVEQQIRACEEWIVELGGSRPEPDYAETQTPVVQSEQNR